MTIPVPFIPTPEHLEAKISFKEADLVIELATSVVKDLSASWDPDKGEVEINYNTTRFSLRVAKGVADALNRSGWNAELKPKIASEPESTRFVIRKKQNAASSRSTPGPALDVS